MSAHQEFFEAQQLLNTLFQTGHLIARRDVENLMGRLSQRVYQMMLLNATRERLMDHQAAIRPVPIVQPRPVARRNPLEKFKVISKEKLKESCPEECAICQDTPKYKDAVCTECNHYYCKTCWSEWMNADGSSKTCPICRKDMPRITNFRARANKSNRLIIED